MSIYKYRIKSLKSEEGTESGLVEASSKEQAASILEDKGFVVLFLEKKKKGLANIEDFLTRIKIKDLVIFSRQLSILISAEVPLVRALRNVVEQTPNPRLKKIIYKIAGEVEGGIRLSEALENYPKVFNDFFINIVRSGEVSGRLNEVLKYLADQLEKDYDLRGKIKGAMIYPLFVFGSLLVIGILMMIFVIPRLTAMLIETGATLPLATRGIIGISNFFVNFWWLAVLFVALIVAGFYMVSRSEKGKRYLDLFKLKLPIFGKIYSYMAIIRLCTGMNTLLKGGVDIVESLTISSGMMNNVIYKDLILETKKTVEDGGEIGEVFYKSPHVPKMVSQMLDTGEETGKVESVLKKISQFYTRELNNIIRNLMSLLEPFIMIVLGVAVGVMIVAIIMPMYEVSSNM